MNDISVIIVTVRIKQILTNIQMGLQVPLVEEIAISEVNQMGKTITVCYGQRQEWNSRKDA